MVTIGATGWKLEISLDEMKSSISGCAFLLDHGGYFWCIIRHTLQHWRNPEWRPLSGADGLRVGSKTQKGILRLCPVFYGDTSILHSGNDDTWSNNDLAGRESGDPVHAPAQGQTTPSNHQGGLDRKLEVFSTSDPRLRHLWATDHVNCDCHNYEAGKHHVGTKLRKLL